MNVLEMKCLRSLVGVSLMDRVRKEEVRRRAGIEWGLANRTDQRVLRWFWHVERIDDRVPYGQKGVDGRSQWRTGKRETEIRLDGWCEGSLGNRGMTVEAVRQCAKDRIALGHFCIALCSFGSPPHALVVITWRGEGCRYIMQLG